MTRAVIYCRCSTEEECQRDALIRQAAEARECVRRLNWSLEDEYIESRSGTSTRGREQYQRLFEDLLRDKFEIVVIKSQDRLMRNTRDWYIFTDRLVTQGKQLYLYLEKRFYSTDDALITGIKAILAEEYSRELSRKINNAHRNRQKTGSALMLTSNTYGYRKMPDKSLAIVEEEAEVKRQMYELCAAGYGSRTIAGILREGGVRKRNGSCFSDSDIRRMIRNPINKGTVVMNRKHYDFDTRQTVKNPEEQLYIYENKIPAIVSEKLWQAANDEIDKRRICADAKNKAKNKEIKDSCSRIKKYGTVGLNPGKHMLSGKLVCGLCGAVFYRTTRNRKKGKLHEWKCRTYLEQGRKKEGRKGGCENICLEEEFLFSLMEKALFENDPVFEDIFIWQGQAERKSFQQEEFVLIKVFLELLKECQEEQKIKVLQNYKQLEKRIRYQQQILLDSYLEGIVDEHIYRKKYGELERKLEDRAADHVREAENRKVTLESEKQDRVRLCEIEKFLVQSHTVPKAFLFLMLEQMEKVIIYPDRLEFVGKDEKSIVAADISNVLY